MTRLTRIILIAVAAIGVAALTAACGTEHIGPPKSDPQYRSDSQAASVFNQRCGGCHTLATAGTQGSGQNPRTYLNISGPNFNQRCERPAIRVLYAIENGGFSGAYMPQNIVSGRQAVEVANFVARYAGEQAPVEPGSPACSTKPIGKLPLSYNTNVSTTAATTTSAGPSGATGSLKHGKSGKSSEGSASKSGIKGSGNNAKSGSGSGS